MPRLPRINVEGSVYYVTSRAVQGEEIFKDKDDYKMYLELMTKYKNQYKFKLYSYCLLPDRLELLVETGDDASISEVMHDLNSIYTKYYNARYQKRGHLFESRFRSLLVEKALYLVAMTRHIHRTPARHPQTRSQAPTQYPYSSFYAYVGPSPLPTEGARPDISAEAGEVLEFLKKKEDPAAYEKYVLETESGEQKALEKSLRRGSVLGSGAFQERVKKRVEAYGEELRRETAKRSPAILYWIGGLVIIATASSVYLYIGKNRVQTQYESLLKEREAQFVEKTRFENISPIALTELDGTSWRVDLVSLPADQAKEALPDTVHFSEGSFRSERALELGFKPARYTVMTRPGSLTTWEVFLKNEAGDTMSWRADWQGDVMKGVMRHAPAGKGPQVFSFYSVGWSFAEVRHDSA